MPSTAKVKYINQFVDRHGKVRIQYREPGKKKVTLRGPVGSPEFWEDYLKASTGATIAQPSSRTVSRGTMTWLVHEYYQGSVYKMLAESTKAARRSMLTKFLEKNGDLPFAGVKKKHALKVRDELYQTPSAADELVKTLAQVFKHAVLYDLRDDNPFAGIPRLKPDTKVDGYKPWTEEQIAQYEQRWPVGTRERVAFGLFLHTAQRRGDVMRLGRQHEKDEYLYFKQQKTGAEMAIPLFDELREILDAGPVGDLTYIVTPSGEPYTTAAGFGNWFGRSVKNAGLSGVSAHGIRKAAASRLAEESHTTNEIAAITGHKTLSEVQRYTASANQKTLATKVKTKRDNKG